MSSDINIANGKSTLRPRARIMRTLGDEMISNDKVAIVELVKNAYDADATRVLIQIDNQENGNGSIEIIDNGHGMSLLTVQNTWMEPATLFKRNSTLSEFGGRRVLGNKGIGRFASSRLADCLELITRRTGSENEVVAFFDWRKFDDESKFLDEIEVNWVEREPNEIISGGSIELLWNKQAGEKITETTNLNQGTILRLTGLRTIWTQTKLNDLRLELSRLISLPVSSVKQSEKEFIIRLKDPSRDNKPDNDRVTATDIFRNPPYTLLGIVDENGNFEVQINLKENNKIIFDKGKYSEFENEKSRCGPFGIAVDIWDRDSEALNSLTEKDFKLKDVRDALDNISGFSIYRDGFRVLPYGEQNNDWLRLDLRSRLNPSLRLANNQIIAYLAISADTNPDLVDQSNREGIIEGPAMNDLRYLVTKMLAIAENIRFKERRDKQKPKQEKGKNLFKDFDFEYIREAVRRNHPEDTDLISVIDEKEKTLKLKMRQFQDTLSRYRRLSTMGQLIDIVLHEGRAPIAKIKNVVTLSKRDISRSKESYLPNIINRFNSIEDQANVLSNVFNRIEPFSGRSKAKPSICNLEEIVKEAFEVLKSESDEIGVSISISKTSTNLLVEKTEILEIIINLFDNSLHWLKLVPENERSIIVAVHSLPDKSVEIIFSDSGPGVEDEDREYIFDPYFTKKQDGVGLGLAISGEIANDYYNGKLELLDIGPLAGATFRILLNGRE